MKGSKKFSELRLKIVNKIASL